MIINTYFYYNKMLYLIICINTKTIDRNFKLMQEYDNLLLKNKSNR